MSAFVLLS